MSQHQIELLARIVRTQCLPEVIDFGITAADFTTPPAISLWNLIQSIWTQAHTRGSVADEVIVRAQFPNYVLPPERPGITTHALCHAVRRERIQVSGTQALMEANNALVGESDPIPALMRLQAHTSSLISLGCSPNLDVSFAQGAERVRRRMQQLRAGIDLSILQFPWPAMNTATMGLQPDDYIVFYGRPKSMKTWTLAYLVAWCYENDKKLLLYTKEMTPDNIYQRIMACICRIVYSEARDAKNMSDEDWRKINQLYDQLLMDPTWGSMITVLNGRDAPPGGDTVSWLRSKVDKHKPVVTVIDGLYLLSDENKRSRDADRVMAISRALRSMVLDTGVPVIATMQANRKAASHNDANLDEIAYSDALSQDCTAAIRTIQRKIQPTEEERAVNPNQKPQIFIDLAFGGSREYQLHGVRINAKPAVDFTQVRELTEGDVLASKEADMEAIEEKKSGRKKKVMSVPKPVATAEAIAQAALASAARVDKARANGHV